MNRMPAVRAYARRKSSTDQENAPKIYAYMTHLRQNLSITMRFSSKHSSNLIQTGWITPFLVFDSIDENGQSRRLQRPVVAATKNLNQNSSILFGGGSLMSGGRGSRVVGANAVDTRGMSSLSAASLTMRQNLLTQSNPTLEQLREANDDLPTPESQMSYKEMPQNAPPLPVNLKGALMRSGTGKANQ